MRPLTQGIAWGLLYLGLVLAPLVLAFSAPLPAAAGFWWDFAMALGYAGVAMLGVQFVLTARFKRPSAPYGIDVIYYFHRYLALAMLAMIVAHALITRIENPAAVGPLDPREAPLFMNVGRLALLLLAGIVASSLWRKQLAIEYDLWRRAHAVLASITLVLAAAHVGASTSYLASPGKRLAWLVITLSWLAVIVYVRLLRPLRLLRRPYEVQAMRREHDRAWTLTLAPVDHAGFVYQPGQFAWLSLRASPFALREHPFSLASSPTRPGTIEFTIKALGDFTATIGDIGVGETAYVDAPYGAFSCDRHADATGYLFIAGGVGIAPIMSMLRALADRGDTRRHLLFYGNRRWERTAFREELQTLAERLDLEVVHILDEPPADWSGEHGLLTQEILARNLPAASAGWHCFVCGPTPMIRIAEQALRNLGVLARNVHSEIFDLA